MSESNESTVARLLAQKLPGDAVRRLPSGQDYVSSHWVITRLNEVFGPLGWEMSYGAPSIATANRLTVVVTGTLTVSLGARRVSRSDVGVGIAAGDKPESVETAYKAAYTDALKRCARTLGPSLGLALYEKERTTVGVVAAAQVMLDAIAALDSADACDRWVAQHSTEAAALPDGDRATVKSAFSARRKAFQLAGLSFADEVVQAIEACHSLAELTSVRQKYAARVKAHGDAADVARIKTAANEIEKMIREAT